MITTPPTETYTWATGSTYDTSVGPIGSAWHSQPNKVAPTSGRLDQGFVPSMSLGAPILNYTLNAHGEWIGWASSSLDSITGAIDAVEQVQTTGIFPLTQEQTFVTRITALAAAGYPAVQSTQSGSWTFNSTNGHRLLSANNFARLGLDLNSILPNRATLLEIQVLVDPGAVRTGNDRMFLKVSGSDHNFSTPATSTFGLTSTTFDDGTANLQVITTLSASDSSISGAQIIKDTRTMFAEVGAGATGQLSPDSVYEFQITWATDTLRSDG